MAGYIGPIPVPQATQSRETFTATASQTSFGTAGYQVGYLDVFMNGVKLAPADFTATNGSDVVLASSAAVNDIIEVVSYSAFEVLNQNFTGTTTANNLTVTGNLTVDGTTTTINSTTLNVDDINITVASGAADSAAANGAGLTVDGAGATFNYSHSGTKWTMNKPLDVGGGLTVSGDAVFSPDNDGVRITGTNYATLRLEENDTTDLNSSIFNSSGAFHIYTSNDARTVLTERFKLNHATGDISFYEDTGTTAKLSWSASNERLFLSGSDYQFGIGQGSNQPWYHRAVSDGSYRLHLNGTGDIVTLDSSGNFFVGKASANLALTGIQATSSGQAFSVTRDGGAPFNLNRLGTADGELAGFWKNTSKVGSIGVNGGTPYIVKTSGGVQIGNGGLNPVNSTGGLTDGVYQLGASNARFTNLHLSGGVVFGDASGASVDNQTQSTYERGTWTPVWTASNQVAYNVSGYQQNVGQYVRIGDYVFCNLYLQHTGSFSGTTTWLRLSGLPYSSVSTLSNLTAGAIYNWGGFTGLGQGDQLIFRTQVGTNQGYFQVTNGGTGRNVTQNDFGGATSLACSFSYRAS